MANMTLVWHLISVKLHVSVQIAFLRESQTTLVTFERLFTRVRVHMVRQSSLKMRIQLGNKKVLLLYRYISILFM